MPRLPPGRKSFWMSATNRASPGRRVRSETGLDSVISRFCFSDVRLAPCREGQILHVPVAERERYRIDGAPRGHTKLRLNRPLRSHVAGEVLCHQEAEILHTKLGVCRLSCPAMSGRP